MTPQSASGDARIRCQRCSANNFAGKTHCWQCSAPLPAPDALKPVSLPAQPIGRRRSLKTRQDLVPPTPAHQAGYGQQATDGTEPAYRATHPGRQPSPNPAVAALLLGVGTLMFLVVWLTSGRIRGEGATVRAPAHTSLRAPAYEETRDQRSGLSDTDPIVDESKLLIEHASRHAGLPGQPAIADDRLDSQAPDPQDSRTDTEPSTPAVDGSKADPPTAPDGRVYLRGGGSITADQYRDARRRIQQSPILRHPLPPPPMP